MVDWATLPVELWWAILEFLTTSGTASGISGVTALACTSTAMHRICEPSGLLRTVFDGGAVSGVHPPYQPQSKAHPINNYGKSKWEGECAVREILNASGAGGRGIIARVPLLYGEDCCDLSESPALEMMKVFLPSASQTTTKKKIDHWALRFPTSTEDVSQVLKLMIDRVLDDTLDGGTYHIASPHGTTKYDLMKMQAKLLNIPTERVDDRTEGNSGCPPKDSAPRPQCTQLDCTDTWKALGFRDGEAFEFVSLQSGMERSLRGFPQRFR